MRLAFDFKRMKVGCPLLQAAYGGCSRISQMFPIETWLLTPTKELQVFEISEEQLETLLKILEKEKPCLHSQK